MIKMTIIAFLLVGIPICLGSSEAVSIWHEDTLPEDDFAEQEEHPADLMGQIPQGGFNRNGDSMDPIEGVLGQRRYENQVIRKESEGRIAQNMESRSAIYQASSLIRKTRENSVALKI